MEMNLENASKSCPDPSPLLSAPLSNGEGEISVEENPHQTIIIPKPQVCRICEPDDEDENGEGLVELGCQCKGEMSMMHKTCLLEWFGIRILLRDNFNCKVCNSMLAFKTQKLVTAALGDHANDGRKILLKGLKRHMELKAFASLERVANHDELVQLLIARRRHETIDVEMHAQAEDQPHNILVFTLGVVGAIAMGSIAFSYVVSLLVGFFS